MTGQHESTAMTKFTTDTNVVYRACGGDKYPAKIVAIDNDAMEPIVARVQFPDAVEFVVFAADGSRDDDGSEPQLVAIPDHKVEYLNLFDDGLGTPRPRLPKGAHSIGRLGVYRFSYDPNNPKDVQVEWISTEGTSTPSITDAD